MRVENSKLRSLHPHFDIPSINNFNEQIISFQILSSVSHIEERNW